MNNESKKVRVAIYMRVSTVEQSEGFGLDMQEASLKEHVERCSYKGWYTSDKWIYQEQASGADTDRKQLNRLLEAAKNNEFDLVLVWKIDRISRSLTDLLKIFEALNKRNIGFASLKEDIDFTGHIGKLIFQIFGAIAEFERSTIQMRTEEGKKMSALAGNFIGGSAPYGYQKVKNKSGKGSKLKLVANEAKIVKQIFNWFLNENYSPTDIAKELNKMKVAKGIGTRSNAKFTKWTETTVKRILENEIYSGKYITNRHKVVSKKPKRYIERPREDWIVNTIESVVTPLTFSQVQSKLSTRTPVARGGGQRDYLFASKLMDPKTGKGFVGYPSAKGTKNYRRKKFTDKETGEVHKTISISERSLYNDVWPLIEKAVNNPKLFLEMHKKASETGKLLESLTARYEILEKAVSKNNERMDKVNRDYHDGNIEQEAKNEFIDQYKEARDTAYADMVSVEKQIQNLNQYDQACQDLLRFSESLGKLKDLTYIQKKTIIQMVVEKIEILDNKSKRIAKVTLRFDQKAISDSIPRVRTDLIDKLNKKPIPTEDIDVSGGR